MGFVSTALGLCGFGVGLSAGIVIGYFLFIYFQPSDVKVRRRLADLVSGGGLFELGFYLLLL